jgi:hypothetical protein
VNASARARRIGVGFHGGQVLELRMTSEQLASLHKALGHDGWHEIESEEGTVRLDVSQVCYVRAESHDQRVGFGT